MEPQIRFCTSADGTRIGYALNGSPANPPMIAVRGWGYALEAWWTDPMGWRFEEVEGRHRAIAIQQGMRSADVRVRIGLNAGEPIEEDEDLFGTAVNLAARIAANADGGEILASNVVRELVTGKNFRFNDRGDNELRGFEDPVRLFEVRWQE